MQNHVTPATAQRLKDAGFPQPAPKVGQMWHNGEFEGFIRRGEGFKKLAYTTDGVDDWFHHIADQVVFSPTATDILRELGEDVTLSYGPGYWLCGFFCGEDFTHENPAEAAALAWLSIHEK